MSKKTANALASTLVAITMVAACGGGDEPPEAMSAGRSIVLYAELSEERAAALKAAYEADTDGGLLLVLDEGAALLDILRRKADQPAADVLLLRGNDDLAAAVDEDLLRPIVDNPFADFPAEPDGYWAPLGAAADLIVTAPSEDAVAAGLGYADLAAADFRGDLCLRRGAHARSQSLVAHLLSTLGERDAELVVRGWRANLAMSVFDDEASLLEAVERGDCGIAIASSDAVANHRSDGRELGAIHWPQPAWPHMLAAGVSRHAREPDGGKAFVAWLTSSSGQAALHSAGFDYSPLSGAGPEGLPGRGVFAADAAATFWLQADAARLIERARYR